MAKIFRFGLIVEKDGLTRARLIETARRAESEGYSTILGTDHLGTLSSLPVLQAAAEATSLRIGTLVLNNDLRHPVVLAHDLATVDLLTEGRLEIGLGAGWANDEYDQAGLAFDEARQRFARLRATVAVLKQALSEGRIERDGDAAYPSMRLTDVPRSHQRPHPPVLIGGGGPRMLGYAAQEAQIVGLDPRALPGGGHDDVDISEARFDQKIEWIRAAAGDRWPQLELNVILFGVNRASGSRSGGLAADELARSPHYLFGTPAEMIATLIERRERWSISYIAVRPELAEAMAPVVEQLSGR